MASAAPKPWPTRLLSLLPGLLLVSPVSSVNDGGYQVDFASTSSIKSAASSMTKDMLSFYNGNKPGGVPGLLPQPYYWWEAGAMFGSLIDYWYYTGDSQYNDLATQGLLFQVGPNNDYMPPNQTLTEGNDDQGFWGLSAMSAAEYNFPDPPSDKPQWLALAQAVFNTQAPRWDNADCNGGLRWQIFTWNKGFDYKNSISQACFFNLATRLALYTGNKTYADWAIKTWDWMVSVKFLDDNYYVYDGSHIDNNCTKITAYQWTYNAGAFLLGAAAMYNYSSLNNDTDGAALWQERTEGMLNGTHVFFDTKHSNIMTEVACEPVNLCDLDQQSFKAYLSRWMAATIKWAPFTTSTIMPLLKTSAEAAVSQCNGGDNGRMCGLRWTDNGKWDGSTGVGQQMAVMEVLLGNMIEGASFPVTDSTGGTSKGDSSAGGSDVGRTNPYNANDLMRPITGGDRAGAGILTALVCFCFVAGVGFMLLDETVNRSPKEHWQAFATSVNAGSKRLTKRGHSAIKGGVIGTTSVGNAFSEKGNHNGISIVDCGRGSPSASTARSVVDHHHSTRFSMQPTGQPTAALNTENDGSNSSSMHRISQAEPIQHPAPVVTASEANGSREASSIQQSVDVAANAVAQSFGKARRNLLRRKSTSL